MSGKFKITDGKGFQFPLENGYTVSIQFGRGNYSENYRFLDGSVHDPDEEPKKLDILAGEAGSHTVELAAWDINNDWVEGHPLGYISSAEVLSVINEIAALPAVEKK